MPSIDHFFFLPLLLTGCGSNQIRWYNPGHNQADYDRDVQECTLIAEEMGRQATLTGKMIDENAFHMSYINCITAKGWSSTPPPQAQPTTPQNNQTVANIARRDADGTVHGFNLAFPIPNSFVIIANHQESHGPTSAQVILLRGPDETYINLMFQQVQNYHFMATDYPVKKPFFLYNRGDKEESSEYLRWATFCGELQDQWMVGLGAYILADKEQRITLAVTHLLPSQQGAVPEGLRITANQHLAAEKFEAEWVAWLQDVTPKTVRSPIPSGDGCRHSFAPINT